MTATSICFGTGLHRTQWRRRSLQHIKFNMVMYFTLWKKMPSLLLSCVQMLQYMALSYCPPTLRCWDNGNPSASQRMGPTFYVGSIMPRYSIRQNTSSLSLTFLTYEMGIITFKTKVNTRPNEIIYLKHLILGT